MMTIYKIVIFLISLLLAFFCSAQSVVSGMVTDKQGMPLPGANVYLKGTYDGAMTDDYGQFRFTSVETGSQTLVVSFISFETYNLTTSISEMENLKISLREDVNTLDAVVLSAGSFSAGDNSKINVLKPLDVVTTASALGDFVGALQTLPGTNTVAEDGRLFVRGGAAEETQIFIDGIRVFTPYSPTTNNIPTRGRYSPFLFDGITFSTGGYSAEFGQALSSVLLLKTIDEPDQDKTDISLMSVGGVLGRTKKWESSSLSMNASYINLAPYIALFPDRNDWERPFESAAGEAVYRKKLNNGLVKLYSAFDNTNFKLVQEDINFEDGINFQLNNRNLYFNGTVNTLLSDSWSLFGGLSYTYGRTRLNQLDFNIRDREHSIHAKLRLKKRFSNRIKLMSGMEYFNTDFSEDFSSSLIDGINYGFQNSLLATFSEMDFFLSKKFAFKAGLRGSYRDLTKKFIVEPRLSLAYKSAENSQISAAYGKFNQSPLNSILKFDSDLNTQKVDHFILNFQFNKDGKIFRAEGFYKLYADLIKYNTNRPQFDSEYSNQGSGHAAGIDLFWRDNGGIRNLDYWVSYSYLDSKRDFRNYEGSFQPDFVNRHNFNLVGKLWVDKWKSQMGFSYTMASGRTYTDPNKDGFLNSKTPNFHNFSINWAYLIDQQKILYASVNNVFSVKNINSYNYSNTPDINGFYQRQAVRPAADQFFFVGFFWTISSDKSSNQLDNL